MEDPIARKTEDLSADRYERLAQSRVSILSNCCWGGLTYHYFKLPFLSPTINLFFTDRDYIRFLENLDGMLEKEPVFDRMAYNPEEDFDYPIFDLCGVKLHMYHCRDKEQGLREWNERRARVNRSKLLVTMITESPETAERFDRLPFEKKVCFVPFRTELPSCVFADPGCIPFVSFVNSFATGTRRLYDPLVLLEEGRIEIPKDGSAQASACTDETEAAFDAAEAVLIYGAKALGTRAFNMLKPLSAGRFAGFAVTSVQGNPSEKYGFPVNAIVTMADVCEYLENQEGPDRFLTDDLKKALVLEYLKGAESQRRMTWLSSWLSFRIITERSAERCRRTVFGIS